MKCFLLLLGFTDGDSTFKSFGIVVKETQKHIQTMFCMAAIVCHILLSFEYERLHNTRPLEPVIKVLNLWQTDNYSTHYKTYF